LCKSSYDSAAILKSTKKRFSVTDFLALLGLPFLDATF
jgi:hypothetical protein